MSLPPGLVLVLSEGQASASLNNFKSEAVGVGEVHVEEWIEISAYVNVNDIILPPSY